jgi:acyl phosphate:glycerol-3-phosphate acyltransferase
VSVIPFEVLIAVTTVLAYFIGGLPFGYWFVRLSSGKDIRSMGSGNIGATNVHRTAGGRAGAIVLLLDILKGFLAVWLASVIINGNPVALALAAAAVMLGHCFPVFLHFRGGKAVACFVGAFLYLTPLALCIVLLLFVLVVSFSKYVSLGSIVGAVAFPFLVWFTHPPEPILAASFFAAVLVIYRHKGNIDRLRRGSEHQFSLRGGRSAV